MIKIKVNLDLAKQFEAAVATEKAKQLNSIVEALKDATPVDTGFARDSWKTDGKTITNDADYIDELNSGHSKQAPSYFIEQTLLAQPGVLPSGTIVRSK